MILIKTQMADQNAFDILLEGEKSIVPVETQQLPVTEVLEEVNDKEVIGKYIGTCKWFNDKLGFGFITICDGDQKGKDIFVHHSGIKPLNSNYRTLKKGEYINFNIVNGMNGNQAVDVTGINGGPLMCDHVIGKKVSMPMQHDMPMQAPPVWNMMMAPPPPPPMPQQWKPVVHKKRFPPNNRPYKRKPASA
jgi:cold shock protein